MTQLASLAESPASIKQHHNAPFTTARSSFLPLPSLKDTAQSSLFLLITINTTSQSFSQQYKYQLSTTSTASSSQHTPQHYSSIPKFMTSQSNQGNNSSSSSPNFMNNQFNNQNNNITNNMDNNSNTTNQDNSNMLSQQRTTQALLAQLQQHARNDLNNYTTTFGLGYNLTITSQDPNNNTQTYIVPAYLAGFLYHIIANELHNNITSPNTHPADPIRLQNVAYHIAANYSIVFHVDLILAATYEFLAFPVDVQGGWRMVRPVLPDVGDIPQMWRVLDGVVDPGLQGQGQGQVQVQGQAQAQIQTQPQTQTPTQPQPQSPPQQQSQSPSPPQQQPQQDTSSPEPENPFAYSRRTGGRLRNLASRINNALTPGRRSTPQSQTPSTPTTSRRQRRATTAAGPSANPNTPAPAITPITVSSDSSGRSASPDQNPSPPPRTRTPQRTRSLRNAFSSLRRSNTSATTRPATTSLTRSNTVNTNGLSRMFGRHTIISPTAPSRDLDPSTQRSDRDRSIEDILDDQGTSLPTGFNLHDIQTSADDFANRNDFVPINPSRPIPNLRYQLQPDPTQLGIQTIDPLPVARLPPLPNIPPHGDVADDNNQNFPDILQVNLPAVSTGGTLPDLRPANSRMFDVTPDQQRINMLPPSQRPNPYLQPGPLQAQVQPQQQQQDWRPWQVTGGPPPSTQTQPTQPQYPSPPPVTLPPRRATTYSQIRHTPPPQVALVRTRTIPGNPPTLPTQNVTPAQIAYFKYIWRPGQHVPKTIPGHIFTCQVPNCNKRSAHKRDITRHYREVHPGLPDPNLDLRLPRRARRVAVRQWVLQDDSGNDLPADEQDWSGDGRPKYTDDPDEDDDDNHDAGDNGGNGGGPSNSGQ